MNKRIRELADSIGLWKEQPPHFTNTDNPVDFPVSVNADLEKFAELIIRECTNIVLHYADVDEGVAVAKKHFGVE